MNKNLPQSTDTQTISFFVVINSKIIFEQKITQCKKSYKVCKELDTSEIYSSRYVFEDYGAKIIKPNALAKKFNRDKDIFYIKINYKNSDKVFIRAVNKVKSGFETSIPGYINFPFVITEGTKSQKLELTTDAIGHFLSNFSVY
jgi:ribosomal protein S19